jgi:hypothetical protein
MSKYHVFPHTVFFRNASRTTSKISWRVVDVDAGINERAWPREVVATCNDEDTARKVCAFLNGVSTAGLARHFNRVCP